MVATLPCGGMAPLPGVTIMSDEAQFPDIFGLPIYRVSTSIKYRRGDELHILKGFETFGQIHWSHIEVWKISELATGVVGLLDTMHPPEVSPRKDH